MKVLVLGHKGMLGHMVKRVLVEQTHEVITTNFRWPSKDFLECVSNFEGEYIINCIGAIHQRTKHFEVNWELPELLDREAKCKVIHPGTDCEMDLDDYGISKKRARDFIVTHGHRTKSIKTSILGPELNTKASLMEWFLSQPDNSKIKGYSEYYWNGNTTLTWANVCLHMMNNWDSYQKETVVSSECIPKYEILCAIRDVYGKNIDIDPFPEPKLNKCLIGSIKTPHIKQQLLELKKFMKRQ